MVVEFKVKNFRSIKDEQTLSLVASSDTSLPENTFPAGKLHLVKAAGLYGANASGKSNIMKAIYAMRQMVVTSADSDSSAKKLIVPFRLDESNANQPSRFELTFYLDGTRFQYGFEATSERIWGEWLLSYPKGSAKIWYIRSINPVNNGTAWKWGRSFRGDRAGLSMKTRPEALFLSVAKQWNHEALSHIFNWFESSLHVVMSPDYMGGVTELLFMREDFRKTIISLINVADLGIHDIKVRHRKIEELPDFEFLTPEVRTHVLKKFEEDPPYAVEFLHAIPNSHSFVALPPEEESSGTVQFFKFIGPWLDTIRRGLTVFVDELECNLHPLLTRQLIEFILKSGRANNEPQLVFTTHDTTQLDPLLLRRDQIWFTEKDEHGSTHLYPLIEYSPRKGEALQKGYLSGRYGAIPVLRAFGEL